jgi:WhiB family transcriptional regulator, redox-sensing transcriptional regulator
MAATQKARVNQKTPRIDHVLPEDQRACYGMDTEIFCGVEGESTNDRVFREQEAVLICRGCELVDECLRWAMTYGERGVWGGTTDEDRRYLRTGKRRPVSTGLGATKQQEARRLRIKIARDLLEKGISFEDIAKELKVKVGTVHDYLRGGDYAETDQGSEAQGTADTEPSRSTDSQRETTPLLKIASS